MLKFILNFYARACLEAFNLFFIVSFFVLVFGKLIFIIEDPSEILEFHRILSTYTKQKIDLCIIDSILFFFTLLFPGVLFHLFIVKM